MTHCAGSYGVRIDGHLKWFKDYGEAVEAENKELYRKVKKKLEAGGRVILTLDMWQQVEQAKRSERTAED